MQRTLFPHSPIGTLGGVVFAALLALVCATDWRSRRIPNWLSALLATTGLAYAGVSSRSLSHGMLLGCMGLVVGFLMWFPLYAIKWLGAGDVKLFAAAGAWLGPMRAVEGAFAGALVGGVLAVVWMIRAYGLSDTVATASLAIAAPRKIVNSSGIDVKSRRAIPYGVALSIGAMAAALLPLP